MKKTYFIADVHLNSADPEHEALFLSFLTMVGSVQGDLYVLGDLFDYWANNKAVIAANSAVLTCMKRLTDRGSLVYVLPGNRDFLLNQNILSRYGIGFLGEQATIRLDDKNIFLTHGHLLCTLDIKFQRYKKRVWPVFRLLDKITPGLIENYLAKKFILKSKQVITSQNPARFQFSRTAINHCFQQGHDVIICGHAHNSMLERFGDKFFYALPAWNSQTGGYVLHYQGSFSLCDFLQQSDHGQAPAL